MWTRNTSLQLLSLFVLLCHFKVCVAEPINTTSTQQATQPSGSAKNPIVQQTINEEKIPPNYFAIAFYKPTYILPYYFTGSPDNVVYRNNTPNDESLKHSEVKYQFSVKVPIWKNILDHPSSLFFAYTQLSYWQLYNKSAFFRETDYEPEAFLANETNWHLGKNWQLSFLNVGATHQSNGFGNSLERSWNRLYLEAIASTDNWVVSFKPWYVISTNSNNNNIAEYLGYGRILVAYKFHRQVFSIRAHNLIEGGARHATAEVSWSFPITPYIKGYVQIFSGYGQSLIEYNHRTNSVGVGVALSDWV